MRETLFLYIDILGFSEIVNDDALADRLFKIIDNARIHRDANFRAIVFSDTIIAYNVHSNIGARHKVTELMYLIEFTQDLFLSLIGSGIFFRAIITEGLFKHSKLTHIESYYGKVLVDAYRAEKELSGTGLYLDRRLSSLNFAFRYKRYSVNYDYVYLTQASSQSTPWLNRNVDLITQSDVSNFPLPRELVEETGNSFVMYAEIMHFKEVHDRLSHHPVPRIREKYITTWHMYSLAYPGLIETLLQSRFSLKSICDCDWNEPKRIFDDERG